MIYLTYKISRKAKHIQLALYDSILNGVVSDKTPDIFGEYTSYHTVATEHIKETDFNRAQVNYLRHYLTMLLPELQRYIDEGIEKHYRSFKIPKHNGKPRQIDAPDASLKTLLSNIKNILQNNLQIHPHNDAFAYIPERSNKHAIQRHQANNSKWFLHIDLKDFFSSFDENFLHQQLQQIYPFSELYKTEADKSLMQTLVKGALYKGRLPQGTPLSPFLTNIAMIPIDYALHKLCKQYKKQYFVYTRYADDIDISSEYDFDYKDILKTITDEITKQSPLQVNTEKIRYGSNAGRNWHLGLMLNQHNNITVGYEKKRTIKHKLMNYCVNKDNWDLDDILSFLGELAYFQNIEPDYHNHLIEKYSAKYNNNIDIVSEMRSKLSAQ